MRTPKSMLNRFQTGQGKCATNLHKWWTASFNKCWCSQAQIKEHTVEYCPLAKLADAGVLVQLHSVDWHVTSYQSSRICHFCHILIFLPTLYVDFSPTSRILTWRYSLISYSNPDGSVVLLATSCQQPVSCSLCLISKFSSLRWFSKCTARYWLTGYWWFLYNCATVVWQSSDGHWASLMSGMPNVPVKHMPLTPRHVSKR